MNYVRRFVFVHYEDLLEIRFKQLEKVTDKLYVFVANNTEQVPLWLVRQLQKMGPDVDWIEIGDVNSSAASSILAFQIGVLHEKVDLGVEFAILSDDEHLDALVEHIHGTGRNCVRVKQRIHKESAAPQRDEPTNGNSKVAAFTASTRQEASSLIREQSTVRSMEDVEDEEEEIDLDLEEFTLSEGFDKYNKFVSKASSKARKPSGKTLDKVSMRLPLHPEKTKEDSEKVVEQIAAAADDIVRRLIRSGNRPADTSMLKSYILLHSDDANKVRNVDEIIAHLEDAGEIRLNDGNVLYNF